jgi:hypothetical protein
MTQLKSKTQVKYLTKYPSEEPINFDYELDDLIKRQDFRMFYLMEDYIGYIHPKTGFEIEYNTLNKKNCFTIFPFGRSEYYEKETKGSIVEVDTIDEVMDLLAKHISL